MDNNYNSVLKEKKIVYEEDDRHFLRRNALEIDFLIIVVILLISFLVYYFNILKPIRVLEDDTNEVIKYMQNLSSNIIPNYNIDNNYNISGNLKIELDTNNTSDIVSYINNYNLDYFINNINNKYIVDLNSNYNNFEYIKDNLNQYIYNKDNKYKLLNLGTDINFYSYRKVISIIKASLLEELNIINYKKNIRFRDGKALVEISTNISGKDINKIYNNIINKLNNDNESKTYLNFINKDMLKSRNIVDDNINIEFVLYNEIFQNNLYEFNIVIREENIRRVINYKDNIINYGDDQDNEYKINLDIKNNSLEVKTYDKEELKYVISITNSDNSSTINYQVINEVDKLSLQIKNNDSYEYILSYKKEKDNKNINLLISNTFNYSNNIKDSNIDYKDAREFDKLSNEEKQNIKDDNYKIINCLKEVINYVNS